MSVRRFPPGAVFTDADDACLDLGKPMPRGAELVRIRTELVEICRQHCSAETVAEAEALLARAVGAMPGRMVQLELFGRCA